MTEHKKTRKVITTTTGLPLKAITAKVCLAEAEKITAIDAMRAAMDS